MTLSTFGRFAFILAIPTIAVACAVESQSSGGTASGGPAPSAPVGSAAPAGDGGASEHPILVPIDTNATMNAAPGQGVGVFTEYLSGGGWHVWWTCDSLVDATNPPCQFDVKISVASGAITLPVTQGFAASDKFTATSTQLEGITTTAAGSNGVTFQTAPGATITLSATVAGLYDGRFIFFVEGGKVDDGFTGTVTDPIMLQGGTP